MNVNNLIYRDDGAHQAFMAALAFRHVWKMNRMVEGKEITSWMCRREMRNASKNAVRLARLAHKWRQIDAKKEVA